MGGMGGSQPTATLPQPLLFAMTDPLRRNGGKAGIKMLQRRAFSFLSTDCNTTHSHSQIKARECKAEIQLGGYDPASVQGKMLLTPSITINDYVVVALSLGVQVGSQHNATLQRFLQTAYLPFSDCLGLLLLGAIPLAVLEAAKLVPHAGRAKTGNYG